MKYPQLKGKMYAPNSVARENFSDSAWEKHIETLADWLYGECCGRRLNIEVLHDLYMIGMERDRA